MAHIVRRAGADIAEPVRRFLEGDLASWLRIEEYRDGGSLVVRAAAPGIDPDKDVDLRLVGNELHIDVRRQERSEHKDKQGYRSEFRYGTFCRTVSVPVAAGAEDIRASYTDGILEVRIPVPQESGAGPRKIPVTRAGAAGAFGAGPTGTVTAGTGTAGTGMPTVGVPDTGTGTGAGNQA